MLLMKRLTCICGGAAVLAAVAALLPSITSHLLAQGPRSIPAPGTPAAEIERLTTLVPDQAHVMADVGYHFANLWFAADKQNWPLADYYLGETRSHLRWAVRIHPVRKTKAGAEIDLKAILDAVDNSFLSEIGTAITSKDFAKFKIAFRQTIEGCYACHKACEKPFLRPQVPNAASVTILNLDPNATWPP